MRSLFLHPRLIYAEDVEAYVLLNQYIYILGKFPKKTVNSFKAALREELLYVIFMDLHKVYDTLDSPSCLEILECYGVGPRANRLLQAYWRR